MKVIADTNIWSLALRRKKVTDQINVNTLHELLKEGQVVFLGPIRQELLSGFRVRNQFDKLRLHLKQFIDFPIDTEDYEQAASFQSICSSNGIQGSPVDLLICAIAHNNNFEIFTLDKDFIHYQKHLPIKLFSY